MAGVHGTLTDPERPSDGGPASPPGESGAPSLARTRRLALLTVVLVAVGVVGISISALALSGGNDGGGKARLPGTLPSAVTHSGGAAATSPPPPSAAPTVRAVPGLAALIASPPADWRAVPDPVARTGLVDIDRAVAIDGHGELSRVGLRRLGFVVGQSRSWQTDSAVLLVLDYTFRDARGAAGFVSYARRARDGDTGFRPRLVPGIPGATGYDLIGQSPTSVAILSRGRSAFIVGVEGTPPEGPAGELASLARTQYDAAS